MPPSDPTSTIAIFDRLIALWETLSQQNPTELGFLSDLAEFYQLYGELFDAYRYRSIAGRNDSFRPWFEKSISVWERLSKAKPQHPFYLEGYYLALISYGYYLSLHDYYEEAALNHTRISTVYEELNRKFPNWSGAKFAKIDQLADTATVALKEGDLQRAQELWSQSVTELDVIAQDNLGIPNYGSQQLVVLRQLAPLMLDSQTWEQLYSLMQKVQETCRRRVEFWPQVFGVWGETVDVLLFCANHVQSIGQTEWAAELMQEATALISNYQFPPIEGMRGRDERSYTAQWYKGPISQYYASTDDNARRDESHQRAALILEELAQGEYPDSQRYLQMLADLYRELGQQDKAIAVYDKAIQRYSLTTDIRSIAALTWAHRGVSYIEVKQFELARQDFSRAIELGGKNPNFYHRRGDAHRELGLHEEAIADYSQAIELNPDGPGAGGRDAWTLAHRGTSRFALGLLDEAAEDYSQAIQLNPKFPAFVHRRGDVYRKQGKYQPAIDDYSQAIALNPHGEWSWSHRGTSRVALERFDEALEDYRRAIELAPQENYFHWRLGEAYQKMGEKYLSERQFQEAINYLTQSLEIDPAAHHRYKRRAVAYFENAEFNKALEDLRQARELNATDLSTLTWIPPNRLSDCPSEDFKSGLMQLADEAVEQNPAARAQRAIIALHLGQISQARQDMFAVIENEKAGYYEYYQAAILALADGRDLEQYRSACQKMLNRFSTSDDPATIVFTGWICAVVPDALDDLSPALQMAQRALEAAPDNIELRRSLGALQYRAGAYPAAIETLTPLAAVEALDGQAMSSSAYPTLILAMAHFGAGEIESAQQTFERAQTLAKSELENTSNVIWNRKLTLELLLEEARLQIGFDSPIERVHDQQ